MHIAEVVTIAKSLPLLRLNTYKSLILSYSADYRRIFRKKSSSRPGNRQNPERRHTIRTPENDCVRTVPPAPPQQQPPENIRRNGPGNGCRPKTSAETVPATTAACFRPHLAPTPGTRHPCHIRTRHPGTRAAEGFAHARFDSSARSDSSARASFSRSASSIFRSR